MVDESWWEEPEDEPEEEEIDLSRDKETYFDDDFGEQGAYGDDDY